MKKTESNRETEKVSDRELVSRGRKDGREGMKKERRRSKQKES